MENVRITLRKKRFGAYLLFLFLVPFGLFFGTAILFLVVGDCTSGNFEPKDVLAPVFTVAFYWIALYPPYLFHKNVPQIWFDQLQISIKGRHYFWTDLEHFDLKGRKVDGDVFSRNKEVVILSFKGGLELNIMDDFYHNTWQLKTFLDQLNKVKSSTHGAPSGVNPQITQNIIRSHSHEISTLNPAVHEPLLTFKGKNQFKTFEGIIMWLFNLMILGIVVLLWDPMPVVIVCFFIAIIAMMTLGMFVSMTYFQLSADTFVVRKINFFWYKHAYRLLDIDEVIFNYNFKGGLSVRVTTKDFKNKVFRCMLFSEKKAEPLIEKLKEYGIKVDVVYS